MPDDFAKLFHSPETGQVLVTTGTSDDGDPSISIALMVEGVRAVMSPGWEDSPAGEAARDARFESLDEEWAMGFAKALQEGGLDSLLSVEGLV